MASPVSTAHTESAPRPRPPTRHLALLLEQASTSRFKVARHSRKEEKKGWEEMMTREVRDWFLGK